MVNVPLNGKNIRVEVTPAGTAPVSGGAVAAGNVASSAVSAAGSVREIKSPLPGTIVRIEVNEGDQIASGDVIAVIEAMKMETEIRAEKAGTVREILVSLKEVVA